MWLSTVTWADCLGLELLKTTSWHWYAIANEKSNHFMTSKVYAVDIGCAHNCPLGLGWLDPHGPDTERVGWNFTLASGCKDKFRAGKPLSAPSPPIARRGFGLGVKLWGLRGLLGASFVTIIVPHIPTMQPNTIGQWNGIQVTENRESSLAWFVKIVAGGCQCQE